LGEGLAICKGWLHGKASCSQKFLAFFELFPLKVLARSSILGAMNKLNTEQEVRVVACLVGGNLLRSTVSVRRITRSPNAFSKKMENHEAAVALHFMFYNFNRIHQTSGITPAMATGVSDHVWSLEEIVSLTQLERLICN
jgi:hypothetical protein